MTREVAELEFNEECSSKQAIDIIIIIMDHCREHIIKIDRQVVQVFMIIFLAQQRLPEEQQMEMFRKYSMRIAELTK